MRPPREIACERSGVIFPFRVSHPKALVPLLALLSICAVGCSASSPNPIPALDWYGRVGPQAIFGTIEANEGNDAPSPSFGGSLTLGSFNFLESMSVTDYDRAIGLELGIERDFMAMDDDVDARWTRYLAGARVALRLDKKLKHGFTFGLAWHRIRFSIESEFSIDGFGGYGGYYVDYSLSEQWMLGADLRVHGYRGRNEFENELAVASTVTVVLSHFF